MKSPNQALKTAIRDLILHIGYNVYSNYVPASAPDNYILLSDVASNDDSTMSSHDTNTTIQIGIYTKANIANSGFIADDIAGAIFQLLYPSPGVPPDIDGFQCTRVSLVNDTSQTLGLNPHLMVNRILVFQFNLFHLTSE